MDKVRFVARTSCPLHEGDGRGEDGALQPWKSLAVAGAQRAFRLLKCPRCDVALTDPYPSADTVRWLYEGRSSDDNFDPMRGTLMDRLKDASARWDLRRVQRTAGRGPFRTVLDYGTGNGRFALACRAAFPGCQVDAADLHADPPESLRGAAGIRYVPTGTLHGESRSYELIILRHVLEHLHDPPRFLSALIRRLSPGGVLYLEVPNRDSAQARLFSVSANAFFLPYHLIHFDRRSLGAFLGSLGLSCRLSTKTLPVAGCVLAAVLKQKRSFTYQLLGIALHPLQLALDALFGKSVLAAVCTPAPLRQPRRTPA